MQSHPATHLSAHPSIIAFSYPFCSPSFHFSTTVLEPLHPPFHTKLTDTNVPECDDPNLNPATPPTAPALPGPLSALHRRSDQPIRHILIYKKVTTLEEIRRGIKRSVDFPYLSADAKVLAADREHQHTIAIVRASIAVTGVEWKEVEVIDESDVRWADAIICVGGDGTFLKASRHIQETDDVPIVASTAHRRRASASSLPPITTPSPHCLPVCWMAQRCYVRCGALVCV